MAQLAGWGRHPVVEEEERLSPDLESLSEGATLSVEVRNLGPAGTEIDWQAEVVDDASGMLHFEAGGSVVTGRGDATLRVVAPGKPDLTKHHQVPRQRPVAEATQRIVVSTIEQVSALNLAEQLIGLR